MKRQTFQPGEIRDEKDNIIQAGAYGKHTPFVNSDNTGILDYIINNFQYIIEGYLAKNEKANTAILADRAISLASNYEDVSGKTVQYVRDKILTACRAVNRGETTTCMFACSINDFVKKWNANNTTDKLAPGTPITALITSASVVGDVYCNIYFSTYEDKYYGLQSVVQNGRFLNITQPVMTVNNTAPNLGGNLSLDSVSSATTLKLTRANELMNIDNNGQSFNGDYLYLLYRLNNPSSGFIKIKEVRIADGTANSASYADVRAKNFIGHLSGNANTADTLSNNTISNNTDFNNITTAGWYGCNTDAAAGTFKHCPAKVALTLEVIRAGLILQRVTEWSTNIIYIRHYGNNSWTKWYKFVGTPV